MNLMSDFHTKSIDTLMQAVLTLKNAEECYAFFEDICTIKEIQDMSQRLEVAELLSAGHNYQEVVEKTNVSTATICRVNKCLNYGAGGYKTAISRMEESK